MRNVIHAEHIVDTIDSKNISGTKLRPKHPEILEIRPVVADRFNAILLECGRNVVCSDAQLRRTIAAALELARSEIGYFFLQFATADRL